MAIRVSPKIKQNFLTLALLIVIFAVFVSNVNCDLAPKEEVDDDDAIQGPQQDLKKDEVPAFVTTLKPPEPVSNLGFIHAFIASFSVIIVSEIGDKTFFIAAIMSMVRTW